MKQKKPKKQKKKKKKKQKKYTKKEKKVYGLFCRKKKNLKKKTKKKPKTKIKKPKTKKKVKKIKNNMSLSSSSVPEEFAKVVKDFIKDIKQSFPEFQHLVNKWWKDESNFLYITDEGDRRRAMDRSEQTSLKLVYDFVKKKYPPRFLDIVYQNESIFADTSDIDTEFLPYIHFRTLWQFNLTDKMRQTIWKYLQIILFSIVHTIQDANAFGESLKTLESMDENEIKSKLEEVLQEIQTIFNLSSSEDIKEKEKEQEEEEFEDNQEKQETFEENQESGEKKTEEGKSFNMSDLPNVEGLHEHLFGIFDGKMGKLAKEIAAETAEELNLDMENVTDVNDLFKKMFSDPGKLMGMFKNIGEKIETKMKVGEIKETEIMTEVTELMNKMKGMPGMNMFQELFGKMGNPAAAAAAAAAAGQKNPHQTKPNALKEWKQKVATKKLLKEFQYSLQQQLESDSTSTDTDPNNILEEELKKIFTKK